MKARIVEVLRARRRAPLSPRLAPLALTFALAAVHPRSALAQAEPPATAPADWTATAIDYSNVPYPYPVRYLPVRMMGEEHRMAYMDVAPVGQANGQTAVI